ncbi:MAG TPA: CHAT domain-containing protein, partial [Candidatus Elarobacter sp.]|nr:CHAT domain-containing protein [Candidatus Elarobacter sp.]
PTARIPFHALMHGGRALVDDHDVYSSPSVAFWQRGVLDPATPSRRSVALGTAHDIDAPVECGTIARILRELSGFECAVIDDTGGVGRVLLPPNGRYKDELAVLHVAAHGKAIPYPDHMSSFIEFDDLCVTAREWLVHGPRAQFVFVNCCFLGRQASRAGDLYGMPFAILGSGTRSAVLAMAPVEPAFARGFAKLFYQNVVDGLGKAAACSGAMRSAIANGTPRRGWVPYFFLGDAAPLNAGG